MIVNRMSWTFWRISARLAWLDLRGAPTRAAFIVSAMAISIASITGVYGTAGVARERLGRDSRLWLAGDLAVDTTEPISDDQMAALDRMRSEGIDWSLITWILTMAASDQAPDPVLIAVKAIDPAKYPFYGTTTLVPPRSLADALRPDSVVVSDRVLERLHVNAGDHIRIGAKPFRISGVIAAEPERPAGIFSWGPRCILSRSAFESIAASAGGNSPTNRIVLRLPPGADAKSIQRRLQALVPEGRVFDYRDAAAPEVARIELVISFLSVIAFLVFALGATGVATAVRLNLEQRIESLAIMRINGARTSQMASLFLFETAAMLGAGLTLGVPLGWAIKASLLSLGGRYAVLPGAASWDQPAIFESAIAALAIMALMLAGPADELRRLRPLAVLRRDAPEVRSPRAHARNPPGQDAGWVFIAAVGIALAAVAGIAYRMIETWKPAVFLIVTLALSACLAWAIGAVAIRCVRSATSFCRGAPVLKHALIGFSRSGSRSSIMIVCIALAVMVIAATFESGAAVMLTVSAALPYRDANLIVADFDESHRQAVRAFLEPLPGVESVEMVTETWLRVARVNGVPVEDSRYVARCAAAPMAGVVIADQLASRLGAGVGSDLEFETRDGSWHASVTAIHHPRPEERFWFAFLADCRQLPQSSLIDLAAVRVRPDRISAVRRAVNTHFPTLAAITSDEIETTIRGVTQDAMTVLRVVTWSAAAGVGLILVTIVAASRAARLREIAILAALGATRRTIFKIYSLEFAALGVVSGAIGALLACGFTSVILSVLFHHVEVAVSWRTLASAMFVSSLLTLVAGWLPTYRLLDRKPMAVLRHERI
jgi:putative ABC transport system permease protein